MKPDPQILAIVDRLTSWGPPGPPPVPLDPPWNAIYYELRPARSAADAEIQLYSLLGHLPDAADRVHQVSAHLPPPDQWSAYPSLRDFSAKLPAPRWLWPSWIPLGTVTILASAPGAGKSLLALDLARRVLGGLPFPDGVPAYDHAAAFPQPQSTDPDRPLFPQPVPPVHVLIIGAEAMPATLNQRATAWGIDCRRLFPLFAFAGGRQLNLSDLRQQNAVHSMCRELRPVLLVVDTLSTVCPGSEQNLEALASLLLYFESLARLHKLALILIHHLRKRGSHDGRPSQRAYPVTIDDLRGCSHLAAAARAILAISPAQHGVQPGQTGPRRLEVIKSNLAPIPPALLMELSPLDEGGLAAAEPGTPEVPFLSYRPCPQPQPEPTRVQECAAWLLDLLASAGEPLKPAEIVSLARDQGFNRQMVYRARRLLGSAVQEIGTGLRDPNKTWTHASAA